jgi:hypothetical protein
LASIIPDDEVTADKNGNEPPAERLKRPRPARTKPNRSYSNLFSPPASDDKQTNASAPKIDGVIAANVEAAYKVIEAQLAFGAAAAERIRSSVMPGSPQAESAFEGLGFDSYLSSYFRTLTEATSLWLKLGTGVLSALAAGQGVAGKETPPATPSPEPETRPSPSIVIAMTAVAGRESSIEIPGPRDLTDVRLSALRSADGAIAKTAIAVMVLSNRIRLIVAVPYGHPAGQYEGKLLASGEPFGLVSLSVLE